MGTSKRFKDHEFCTRCGKDVINLSAEEQEEHIKNCLKQQKLF